MPALSRLDSQLTSSPSSSAPSQHETGSTIAAQSPEDFKFSSTKPIPYALQKQIDVYFEENLFPQAFDFLRGSLAAQAANPKTVVQALQVPSAECLRLIANLCVHPTFTSRSTERERSQSSSSAISLLLELIKAAGPVNLNLAEIFLYRNHETLGHHDNRRTGDEGETDARSKLNTRYAQEDNVFALSADFWNVVGWAMNCACSGGSIEQERWHYWAQWLELMAHILETDWAIREEQKSCHGSLLWHYLREADGGNGRARRILRAIFADGMDKSAGEFGEIFNKELKPLKQNQGDREMKDAVCVDREIYGDWLEASDSESEQDQVGVKMDHNPRPTKRTRHGTALGRRKNRSRSTRARPKGDEGGDEESDDLPGSTATAQKGYGGTRATSLRLRMLQLLSNISAYADLNMEFEIDFPEPHELFTLFVEFIRPLPLPSFQQMILPFPHTSVRDDFRIALCEFVLQRIVDNHQRTRSSTFDEMTMDRFVSLYLPFDAVRNQIEAQVKVGLLLESILRLLFLANPGSWPGSDHGPDRDGVLSAFQEGHTKRLKKAKDSLNNQKFKRARDHPDQVAMQMLQGSGQRMKFLLHSV